ncbi:glycoside hydrolase family 13 protein [Promicromonospora thailandica]|uniref:Alpha-glucosidase n=1 Tax=Promicromonospora thailandica TaxID=765201 RepID=A0A9X2JUJ8_9MICO|nr:glycoside hydrolase family 13 protein [Promicromonospora thailandica]MCP2264585.1 alpha-glucosidase [Promicromonospora thailandica]BFF20347.1 glycoside hydrolase family 13 protein [Promicromonospora thailandica]
MTEVMETRLTPDPTAGDAATWWRQAAVYQIYPRAFADANGDGLGDLPGITARVPYLRSLGVDAVWLSPFYPSALADGGYDVDDYRDVDPRLGTLEDFDALVAALHDAGIKLIVDLVPNHTSDRHVWFQEALAAPKGSPARDRYIFRDGKGPDGAEPPADWPSTFGGPAWEPVGDGQWYMHHFAVQQPDLNWKNPEVRADFLRTLRFWSDRGVDGFRVDVAHGLAKDLGDELPSQAELDALPWDGNHPLWDRDEVHEIYAEWRGVFNSYDPPRTAVAEAWVAADRRARYASSAGLGQAFNFDLLEADFDAAQFREIITFNLELAAASGSSTTWVFSNHDVVRHATRYGLPPRRTGTDGEKPREKQGKRWLLSGGTEPELQRELGLRRARAATLLELALPGSSYLYQGEELGLHEVPDLPDEARQDPTFFRSPGVDVGRDGCRVPLPWTREGASFGFGPGSGPADLPQPDWFGELAVEVQEDDAASTLTLYRRALGLRRELQTEEELTWVETGHADVLAFRRPNGWLSVTNFGDAAVDLPDGEVLLASAPLENGRLPGATTAWLRA